MVGHKVVGGGLLLVGVCVFVVTWRSIGWMVYGGARDFVQLGLLMLGAGLAAWGVWVLCVGRSG